MPGSFVFVPFSALLHRELLLIEKWIENKRILNEDTSPRYLSPEPSLTCLQPFIYLALKKKKKKGSPPVARNMVVRLFSLVFYAPLHISNIFSFGTGESKFHFMTDVGLEFWLPDITFSFSELELKKPRG